jgi:hypothetical protein
MADSKKKLYAFRDSANLLSAKFAFTFSQIRINQQIGKEQGD